MLNQIKGLHHVTSMAKDARQNNQFFTGKLGLRRVKTTVNFDAPEMYHLYFGDESGAPGSILTFFEIRGAAPGRPGGDRPRTGSPRTRAACGLPPPAAEPPVFPGRPARA